MIHLILASHDTLAESMIKTAAMICGPTLVAGVKAFCMTEGRNVDDFIDELQKYVDEDPEGEYFAMVDLYGASPCTSCVRVLGRYNYRLVTGLNLAMMLEAITSKDNLSLEELEEKILTVGKEAVNKFYLHV